MEAVAESKDFSFPDEELKVLEFWEKIDAFQQQLERRKGSPSYVFYDGPPFATGLPHYGHLLAGSIKARCPDLHRKQELICSLPACHWLPALPSGACHFAACIQPALYAGHCDAIRSCHRPLLPQEIRVCCEPHSAAPVTLSSSWCMLCNVHCSWHCILLHAGHCIHSCMCLQHTNASRACPMLVHECGSTIGGTATVSLWSMRSTSC